MNDHYYAVIMAGGGGTRLWPLSRRSKPKQLLTFGGDNSLFQMAVKRLEGVFPPDHIIVVTTESLAGQLRQHCPQIPGNNFLLEPFGKGTASVVGLAAIEIKRRDDNPEASMAVLTADHFIRNVPYFRNLLNASFDVAQNGYLVTLGIHPTYSATGYGYIQRGEWIGGYQGHPVYHVIRFIEKPDEIRAKAMVKEGTFEWNSGMFIWRVDRILGEIEELMPDLWNGLIKIENVWNRPEMNNVFHSVWEGLKTQTIDYGIMEKASKTAVLTAESLGWNDVSSWDSLYDVLPTDDNGNVIVGTKHIGIETNNSIVYAEKTKRLIVTVGARNLIIVDTGDALLVCPREETQNVRRVIDLLNETGSEEYL